jgi:hypothetical protein
VNIARFFLRYHELVTRRFEALLSECAAEYLLFWAFQEGFSARMQRVLQSERRHWKALVAATGRRRLMKGFWEIDRADRERCSFEGQVGSVEDCNFRGYEAVLSSMPLI